MNKFLYTFFTAGVVSATLLSASNNNFSGNLRLGYQSDLKSNTNLAFGVRLQDRLEFDNFAFNIGLFGVTGLIKEDGEVNFFDNHKSYGLIGIANINAKLGDSELTIGRQELETPFADGDERGMIPNLFEAFKFENNSIKDTN